MLLYSAQAMNEISQRGKFQAANGNRAIGLGKRFTLGVLVAQLLMLRQGKLAVAFDQRVQTLRTAHARSLARLIHDEADFGLADVA